MGYRNLSECVADLERAGRLVRVDHPIDPHLEMAEVQRRLYRAKGPAVLFTRPKGTAFPMLANLFGTVERTRFLFRDALAGVRKLVDLKADPGRGGTRTVAVLGPAAVALAAAAEVRAVRSDPRAPNDRLATAATEVLAARTAGRS